MQADCSHSQKAVQLPAKRNSTVRTVGNWNTVRFNSPVSIWLPALVEALGMMREKLAKSTVA